MRLEGLDKFKTSSDLIWNRTRDLPACNIVPQPTTLPLRGESTYNALTLETGQLLLVTLTDNSSIMAGDGIAATEQV
jgi:hypothetical protein